MTRHERDVASALDALVPPTRDHGNWEAVLCDARRRRVDRSRAARMAVLAAAAVGVTVLALAWPFAGDEPGGVLDRALAAVGDGPVLHVVLEGTWGGDVVDLETGRRRAVRGTTEIWYDGEQRLIRTVSRLGSVVQGDETYRPRGPDAELAALGERYRDALASGTARVLGEDEIAGTPVWWIVVRREELPDVADGRVHPWTQQVAVSRETYEPVALRDTRDGVEAPGTRRLVRVLEYVGVAAARFGDPDDAQVASGPFYATSSLGGEELTPARAREVLGRPPLWGGPEIERLPLARVGKTETGRIDPATGEHTGVTGVSFVYGRLERTAGGEPRFEGPFAIVSETVSPPWRFGSSPRRYAAPPGTAYVSGPSASLYRDGLYVTVTATSAELALDVARALRPMGT